MSKTAAIDGILYCLLLFALFIFRIQVLKQFSFVWTDGDQVLMWHAAKDFSEGLFYETRFYGQSYNTMLEGLIAAPFYKSSVPINQLLPVITSILAIFPYILISLHVFLKKSSTIALLIISIPLILPINFSFITSIPRGFVTGIFAASLLYVLLDRKSSGKSFFAAFFIFILSYTINPNAIFFSIPCLVYIIINNYTKRSFYLPSMGGLAFGLLVHYLLNLFYILHPNYNLHRYTMSYSFKNFWQGIQNLNFYFKDISIVFVHFGISIFIVFVGLSILLAFQKQKVKSLIVALIPILILFTLSMSKLHDALDSIFYSYSRMYLAMPLALALAVSFLEIKKYTWGVYIYLFIPISCLAYNYSNLKHKVEIETNTGINHMVSIRKVDELKEDCEKLKKLSIERNIDLIVIGFDWRSTLSTYGCASCVDNFPKTLFPAYERRTWRMVEDAKTIYKNILIVDEAKRIDTLLSNVENIEQKNNFYFIKNNQLKTFKLLDSLGLTYRPF
jgi:hypothetical protein